MRKNMQNRIISALLALSILVTILTCTPAATAETQALETRPECRRQGYTGKLLHACGSGM